MANFENKSISELEGWKWKSKIPKRETHGGIECRFYELHNIPITKLGLDDIRFLIGQNSALEYLVPKAIKELQKNLFIETEYYEGDLFCSLLKINNKPNYWLSHEKEKQELINLYNEQKKMLGILDLTENTLVKIKEAYKEFIQ